MPQRKSFPNKKILISVLIAVLLLGLGWRTGIVRAGHTVENSSNANCIMCHQSDKLKGVTQDSHQVSLTVSTNGFNQSVHGEAGLLCSSCHTTFTTYPHSDIKQVTCEQCHEQNITVIASLPHENRRTMEITLNETCRNCHAKEYSAKSMHSSIALSGQINTPLCTDCHGGHEVQHPAQPPARITVTCGRCHTAIYKDFQANKHSSADPLTQSCATCHIAHDIQAAAETVATPQPTTSPETGDQSYLSLWNGTCTMCHAYPNLIGKARDSTTVSLTVTGKELSESVHGKAGLGCAACHKSITAYPHQETEQIACSACHASADPEAEIVANLPFESSRAVSIQLNEACITCHKDEYKASADSMHTKSLEDGNLQAPQCVDCHGSHAVQSPNPSRASISQSCARCHASVYTSYQSSVHGTAIEKDGSPDAPTCEDCHGVHTIIGPSQANFRSQSVATCVRCHQDQEMMSKYGISADLFTPNMDGFHDVALSLFNQQGGDPARNTAVCYDCHGVHTIRKADDPHSSVYPANLVKTCQNCHPDAGIGFAGGGIGHSNPASGALSLQSRIEQIYFSLILGAFGFLLLYILLDARKSWASKKERNQPAITGS